MTQNVDYFTARAAGLQAAAAAIVAHVERGDVIARRAAVKGR
jgi:hypothetical protein